METNWIKKPWTFPLCLMIIVLLAAGLRSGLALADRIPFNSDEAVVGLMARHILQGENSLFFWGQSYMGSLDAYLVAGAFSLLGESVFSIRIIQILLAIGTTITTAFLGECIFHSKWIGVIGALLVAIPSVNGVLYTTASLGGYGEALLLGNLILLIAASVRTSKNDNFPWLAMGFLGGFGFWVNGLTLVYFVPAITFMIREIWLQNKTEGKPKFILNILLCCLGFCAGALPWIVYFVAGGNNAIHELFGSAVDVEGTVFWMKWINHFVAFLLLGTTVILGFRPPWTVRWLGLPLIPFVMVFWGWVIARAFSEIRRHRDFLPAIWLLGGTMCCVVGGFIFTSFGIDPSGRYFLPFITPMALFAGWAIQQIRRKWLRAGIFGLLMVFTIWGIADSALTYPPGLNTQFDSLMVIDHRYDDQLHTFLRENHLTRGYTQYWIAYPMAFQSQEELIFVPRLPYHQDMRYTPRDDRYLIYDDWVRNSKQIAYITANNELLDTTLIEEFQKHHIQFQEKWIGDYHIFYQLSSPIHPDEMGLGSLKE